MVLPTHLWTRIFLLQFITTTLCQGIASGPVPYAEDEWSLPGGCQEPPPVANSYRTVDKTNDIIHYTCAPGSVLESGSRVLQCEPDGKYNTSEFPICSVDCGVPISWSFASIDSGQESAPYYGGRELTYSCNVSDGTTWLSSSVAECEEDYGWDPHHPPCLEDKNFADEMDFDLSDGDGVIEGDCAWVYNTTGTAVIALEMKNPINLINVYSVSFDVDQSKSNAWIADVYVNLKRNGDHVYRRNMTSTFDAQVISDIRSSFSRGVNEIQLESRSSSSIGICRPNITGRRTEGDCPKPIPPFKTRLKSSLTNHTYEYMPDENVYLECNDGFNYIGGRKYLFCDYYRTWKLPDHFMECTDRRNHAIGSLYQAIFTPSDLSTVYTDSQLIRDDIFDAHEIAAGHSFLTVPEYVSVVVLRIYLEYHINIERITLELPNGQTPYQAKVYSVAINSTGKFCYIDDDLEFYESHTFLCNNYPRIDIVEVAIFSTSGLIWTVEDLVIIGEVSLNQDKVLECYYTDSGMDYKGVQNVSIDGQACLPWMQKTSYDINDFPDTVLNMENNFCRNPDPTIFNNPFCMTSNGPAYCSVPPCEKICSTTLRGDDYLGTVSETSSFQECLHWRHPSLPFGRDSQFPDDSALDADNHCRNPGLSQIKPWCYTDRNPPQMEHCTIPRCPESDAENLQTWQWVYYNDTEVLEMLPNYHLIRCFTFDFLSGESGKSAWLQTDVAEILSEICVMLGSRYRLQSVCLTQERDNDTLVWNNWGLTCPEITTTTSTTSPSTMTTVYTATQTPITTTKRHSTSSSTKSSTTTNRTLTTSTSSQSSSSSSSTSSSSTSSPATTTTTTTPNPASQTITSSTTKLTSLPSTKSSSTTSSSLSTIGTISTLSFMQLSPTTKTITTSPPTTQYSQLSSSTSYLPPLPSPPTSPPTPSTTATTAKNTESSTSSTTTQLNQLSPILPTTPTSPAPASSTTTTTTTATATTTTTKQTTASPSTALPTTSNTTTRATTSTSTKPSTSSPSTLASLTALSTTTPPPSTSTSLWLLSTPSSSTSTTSTSTSTSSSVKTPSPPNPPASTPTVNLYTSNCSCSFPVYINLTENPTALDDITEEIVKDLTVDKTQLSSTKRAKTCAEDNRETAVTAGAFGVALLLTVACWITIPDAITLIRSIHSILL